MTQSEAKEYVHKTLATGNKERIADVMRHYFKFINSAKTPKEDIVSIAEKIFNQLEKEAK